MSFFRLLARSVVFHARVNLAVALGVAAGTAVLTGALLVGDSVRESLRQLTLSRLGPIDEVLVAPTFFRAELASELAAQAEFQKHFSAALPATLLTASLVTPDKKNIAGRVTLIAGDDRFWELGTGGPPRPVGDDEIVLNQPLADKLGVQPGDAVLLKLSQFSLVPPESALGRKSETVRTRSLTVWKVIPAQGLGRFGLQPNQQLPLNAYTSLATAQSLVGQSGRVNAMIVAGRQGPNDEPPEGSHAILQRLLQPQLADYGVRLVRTPRGYFNMTTDRMLFDEPVERAAAQAFAHDGQVALTYLANYISTGQADQARIPYSTVTALDFSKNALAGLGPWPVTQGKPIGELADDEIALNSWAFDDLQAQLAAKGEQLRIGDRIRLTYFAPEHSGGSAEEQTAQFKLAAVIDLDGDSAANDRGFTPEVAGVTDQESIENWDPPFPFFQSRVRDQDEAYWDQYHATPKAFVSLARGQALWGSRRFGRVTSVRVAASEAKVDELAARLKLDPEEMGFRFQAVKRDGLAASRGTTPFGVLFLAFSSFMIAAAVMLLALLYRLSVESRAEQIGTFLALGIGPAQVRKLLLSEGLIVGGLGSVLGAALGAAYAAAMVHGLRTWWVAAISTPFLQWHAAPSSFVLGGLCGMATALVVVGWVLRSLRKLPVRRLLSGQARDESPGSRTAARWSLWLGSACLLAAAVMSAMALARGGSAQTSEFFGAGAAVLAGLLALLWNGLRSGSAGQLVVPGGLPLARLAVRNGGRHPGRSTLTIGLMAAATFLIVALGAFQIDPTLSGPNFHSGNGGFPLVAESALPIFADLNDPKTLQEELGLQDEELRQLRGTKVYAFRVLPGEDASCNNLYQTQRPRVLGVPEDFLRRGGFAWASSAAQPPKERDNPWLLLMQDAGTTEQGEPYVPVVLDQNTAFYSLKLYQVGATRTIVDDWGRTTHLKVVGFLSNSVFQGDVLMSRPWFQARFPDVNGHRFFAIEFEGAAWSPPAARSSGNSDLAAQRAGGGQPGRTIQLPSRSADPSSLAARTAAVQRTLQTALADYGFDAQRTGDRLKGYLAVQNTYLLTFQSLGALGLLLGTFGLAAVQLRNVLERRNELALMQAAGFATERIAQLVLAENAFLLLAGLGCGVLAALVAVLPHFWQGGASFPWLTLGGVLAAIVAIGLVAGLIAVRAVLRAPLIPALRGD